MLTGYLISFMLNGKRVSMICEDCATTHNAVSFGEYYRWDHHHEIVIGFDEILDIRVA